METRKLAYVIALTAAATTGINQIPDLLITTVSAGQNETRSHQFTLAAVPGAFNTRIEAYLSATECAKVDAKFGSGSCDSATVPYDIRLMRKANGKTRVVGKLLVPVFVTIRPPVAPPEPPEEP